MRYWFKATWRVQLWAVVVTLGVIVSPAFALRVPYPTLFSRGFDSSSIAVFLAAVPAILWLAVIPRRSIESRLSPVRVLPIILDLSLVLGFPALLAIAAAIGDAGARATVVPSLTQSALVILAACFPAAKGLRALPAIALAACLLVGNGNRITSVWSLAIAERPTAANLMVTVGALIVALAIYAAATVRQRR
ncbi:MAG TPA: hypothetical protein VHZ81_11240 [Galbitalea sp.]|nr:hypothetical protein [Galbitalea sp.]